MRKIFSYIYKNIWAKKIFHKQVDLGVYFIILQLSFQYAQKDEWILLLILFWDSEHKTFMLVCLACTFFKIYDFFMQVYSICNLIFSDSSLFLYSATVNDSLEMAFAEKKSEILYFRAPWNFTKSWLLFSYS